MTNQRYDFDNNYNYNYSYERNNTENNGQETGYEEQRRSSTGRSARQRRRHRKSLVKSVATLALAGVLFGSAAGGTAYAVNRHLSSGQTVASSSVTTTADADTVSLVSTTTSDSDSQNLDVSDIASMGLTSVVSVTNISVQQVENYFSMYGRGGGGNIGGESQTTESTSVGSGVIIYSSDEDLYMVTNYHVVEDATTLSVTFVDDETYEATICGYDEDRDIAVIKVSLSDMSEDTKSSITIAAIGSSDDLSVGEQVVAIGNALGYGQSVTTGIISAVDRTVETSSESNNPFEETTTVTNTYLQTDAAINPGNSGGALFNMNGELVGINTAKISSTGVEGMGYAIPISEVLDMINSFID